MMKKIIGVIPARWASTRFEGKVLALIDGKPMIEHVWRQARKCDALADIIIACDDKRILAEVKNFGGRAIMTSPDHPSGTDRIAEAVKDVSADIIVNIQGDEPLIRPEVITALAKALSDDSTCPMATVIKKIDNDKDIQDPNVVKVVIDKHQRALYFSRAPIPFNRDGKPGAQYYKHIGLYAYTKDFLKIFISLPKSRLEQIEKLEQLRVIEAGYPIKTVETTFETVGVDTPDDLKKVQSLMKSAR
jgi:3-deoxy-manno-octulosonate cytidylyltransferase (CMP-KDO synthetase)